jgi:hypothetical protein
MVGDAGHGCVEYNAVQRSQVLVFVLRYLGVLTRPALVEKDGKQFFRTD